MVHELDGFCGRVGAKPCSGGLRIADPSEFPETFLCRLPCHHDPQADGVAGFAGRNRAWVDAFHRRHFDLNVDAVEDRPRQAAEVLDTVFFPARAALAVAVCVAAGARIGRHDQLESCRIVGGAFRAGYRHIPGFQWFAQGLQGACREFGRLVHE